jgi:hypothetical protein
MMGHHFFMDSLLNSSGPGDFPFGKFTTTLSISSLPKGKVRLSKSGKGWMNLDLGAAVRIQM